MLKRTKKKNENVPPPKKKKYKQTKKLCSLFIHKLLNICYILKYMYEVNRNVYTCHVVNSKFTEWMYNVNKKKYNMTTCKFCIFILPVNS